MVARAASAVDGEPDHIEDGPQKWVVALHGRRERMEGPTQQPLSAASLARATRFKYSALTSLISSSPRAEGRKLRAISTAWES
jgi:hypothetical protein